MARQRRGGGFRPPEIRGTLGTLLRTTLEQAGAVRDALGRGAREGRSRLDEALSGRRRKDALAELGELVLDLIRRGEIDLGELPEAEDLVRFLDDLDADAPDEPHDRIAQPPTRGRFDARSREPSRRAPSRAPHPDDASDGTVSAIRGTVSSPRGAPSGPRAAPSPGRSAASSPGRSAASSSSDRWSPPKPSAPQRVWRPSLVEDDPPPEPLDSLPSRPLPRDPLRKGGIAFDDDEDLADYMHPDDVPPKPPSDGDQ